MKRHELCVKLVEQKMGLVASYVVKVILENSLPFELEANAVRSFPCNLQKILSVVRDALKEYNIDLNTLKKVIELLKSDGVGIIDVEGGSKGSMSSLDVSGSNSAINYYVNMANIVKSARCQLVQSIADDRFGKASGRIIQLLIRKRQVEQQKLSELAILPGRDARARLYDLYRCKWIDYFEITKRSDIDTSKSAQNWGADGASGGGSNVYYFWTLDEKHLHEVLQSELYKTLYNLRSRRQMEFSQGKELVDFSHRITDMEEALRFDKLSLSLDRLDCSVLRLLESISLFEM